MGRKKKDKQIKTTDPTYKFNPETISSSIDLTPDMIEVTSLEDRYRHYIYGSPYISSPYTISTTGTGGSWSTTINSETLRAYNWGSSYSDLVKKINREEETNVKVVSKPAAKGEHIVACENKEDLTVENILKTLSVVKGKLITDVSFIHIKEIICTTTPTVRRNIITAGKKLKMYGKKVPVLARFDEYGNRLPDEINIGDSSGITLRIIEPDEEGEFYLELKAIEFPSIDYNARSTYSTGTWTVDDEELPF